MDQPNTVQTIHPMQLPKKKGGGPVFVLIAVIVMLLAAAGYLGWLWWAASDDKTKLQTENTSLKSQVEQLQARLSETKKTDDKDSIAPCSGIISDELKANIRDAISSKNTAALEGYMTNPVTVIIAASEGVGPRTPTQAVADLDYLGAGTAPWDFNLSPATIASYQAGFYKDYFPATAVVGKSANNYVVSFSFDECAKIKTVFMAVNADLLL